MTFCSFQAGGGNQSNDDKGSNEDSDEDSEEEDFKTAAKAAVKALGVNKKTHYLFVKVPPRNSARYCSYLVLNFLRFSTLEKGFPTKPWDKRFD